MPWVRNRQVNRSIAAASTRPCAAGPPGIVQLVCDWFFPLPFSMCMHDIQCFLCVFVSDFGCLVGVRVFQVSMFLPFSVCFVRFDVSFARPFCRRPLASLEGLRLGQLTIWKKSLWCLIKETLVKNITKTMTKTKQQDKIIKSKCAFCLLSLPNIPAVFSL